MPLELKAAKLDLLLPDNQFVIAKIQRILPR